MGCTPAPHGLGGWQKYDRRMQRLLGRSVVDREAEIEVSRSGVPYVISLDLMTETNLESGAFPKTDISQF